MHVVIRIQPGYAPLPYGPFEAVTEADELHKRLTREMMDKYEPWDATKPRYYPMLILEPPKTNDQQNGS